MAFTIYVPCIHFERTFLYGLIRNTIGIFSQDRHIWESNSNFELIKSYSSRYHKSMA